MADPVIVEAVRTPVGRCRGVLAGLHPAELLGIAQNGVVDRAGIAPEEIDQVIGGCVTRAGEQAGGVARLAGLHAGLPYSTAWTTVDMCAGGAHSTATINERI